MLQSWGILGYPGVSCGVRHLGFDGLWGVAWGVAYASKHARTLGPCRSCRVFEHLEVCVTGIHRDPQGSTGNINLWFIEAMLSYQKAQVLVIAFYCFLVCVCANLWLDMFFVLLVRAKGPENTATDANHVIFWILLMFMAGLLRTAGVILCVGTWHPAMTFLQGCSSQHLTMFSRGYMGLIVALRQLRRWCLKLRDQKRVRSCEILWVCDDTCIFLSTKIMDQVGSTSIVCLGWRVFSYDALTKSPEFDSNGDIKELRALKEEARPFSFSGSHMLQFKLENDSDTGRTRRQVSTACSLCTTGMVKAPCQPCIKCWYSRARQVQLSGQPGKCQNALKYHEVSAKCQRYRSQMSGRCSSWSSLRIRRTPRISQKGWALLSNAKHGWRGLT